MPFIKKSKLEKLKMEERLLAKILQFKDGNINIKQANNFFGDIWTIQNRNQFLEIKLDEFLLEKVD